jgi:hypothetical protein
MFRKIAALRDRAAGDARYSEDCCVDRTLKIQKSVCAVVAKQSTPLVHRICAKDILSFRQAERPAQGQFVMESESP